MTFSFPSCPIPHKAFNAAKRLDILVHSDAAQSLGKVTVYDVDGGDDDDAMTMP